MRGSGTEALLTALFVALFASPSVGADDVHIDLVLRGAVFQKEAPGPADPALLVDVNRSITPAASRRVPWTAIPSS